MIAQLSLVVHYPEVVVVTGAEHTVRNHLILAFTTFDRPESSSARPEPVIRNTLRLNDCKRLGKTFLESFGQGSFLLFRQKMGLTNLLGDLSQNAIFR
jgi:hypothetical protein